jgi:hypothetical protein
MCLRTLHVCRGPQRLCAYSAGCSLQNNLLFPNGDGTSAETRTVFEKQIVQHSTAQHTTHTGSVRVGRAGVRVGRAGADVFLVFFGSGAAAAPFLQLVLRHRLDHRLCTRTFPRERKQALY